MSIYKFIAWTSPGLQKVFQQELKQFKINSTPSTQKILPSTALEFQSSLTDIMKVMHYSRTITYLNIALNKKLDARSERELQLNLQRSPLHAYIPLNADVIIKCHCMKSKLMHSKRWEQALSKALLINQNQRLITHEHGTNNQIDETVNQSIIKPQQIIMHIYIFKDKAQVMFQLHTESLHKQGLRQRQGQTPLTENVASAMADYVTPEVDILWDPFCGSGSLIFSVLQKYIDIPLRLQNNVYQPFMSMPIFPKEEYAAYLESIKTSKEHKMPFRILASDRDPNQLKQLHTNLRQFNYQVEAQEPLDLNNSKTFLNGNVQVMQSEFTKFLRRLPRLNAGRVMILSNLPWNIHSKIDNFDEILELMERSSIQQMILLISDKQWKSMKQGQWELKEEVLVGGTWAKIIQKKVQSLQILEQSTEIVQASSEVVIFEDKSKEMVINKVEKQLRAVKSKMANENIERVLQDRAKAKIPPVVVKGSKKTKGIQITQRLKDEFVSHEKYKLKNNAIKLKLVIEKNQREQNIEGFKRQVISKSISQLTDDEVERIQRKLDLEAQKKAKSILTY